MIQINAKIVGLIRHFDWVLHKPSLDIKVIQININEVNDSSFISIDYIIFYFPKTLLQLNLLNQSNFERMIGWIIKLNDTEKCVVLNKPKFKFFESLKFTFIVI